MLLYVFWHWPTTAPGYEERFLTFQRRLNQAGAPGFLGSAVFRISELPWANHEPAYEDWYLVEGFAALGELNAAAVSGGLKAPHDAAASGAAGGAGGLYLLKSGRVDFADGPVTWISKPAGLSYEDFYRSQAAAPWLLQRQMVLGPSSEFCVPGKVEGDVTADRVCLFHQTG